MQTIPPEQCRARMRVDNPWWEGTPPQTDSFYRNLRPRAYFRRFAQLLATEGVRRAIVLMGPRRVGKTVLLQHAIQELLEKGASPHAIACLSLDQPLYANLSIETLVGHLRKAGGLQGIPAFLFLDEIQYLPDWERHLKAFVDSHPQIRCVASGSAAAALRLKSIESGAGRFTDFLLPPLTFYEYLELQDLGGMVRPVSDQGMGECDDIEQLNEHFIRYINIGGYPEAVFSETIRQDVGRYIRSDIIDKVLLRDLPSLYGIQDIQELNNLFMTLAWNTAQEISLDELSRNSGVTKPTIKRYLEYLQAAFLIKTVHRIDRNARRFKRANFFKVYLTNPSMRCALFGPVGGEALDMGVLSETAVFSQWFHQNQELHYARWSQGEVDIVGLDSRQRPAWCVEVKWSDGALAQRRLRSSLKSFLQKHPGLPSVFTTRTETGKLDLGQGRQADCIPTSVYCYMLGFNIIGGALRDRRPAMS
ncbi:MAG: ATP-binding protein [Gammaproteobacteria bacterium]|nr:ATP-binding protein [Gammaproteobacteria bacterium]